VISVPELKNCTISSFFLHASRQVGSSPDHFHRVGLLGEESHYYRELNCGGCRLAKGSRFQYLGSSNHVDARDEWHFSVYLAHGRVQG
jgi:hypothetical protein